MFGFGVVNALDDGCQVVVQLGYLLQGGRILGFMDDCLHLGTQWVSLGNKNIIDCGYGRGVVFWIDPDRVGQSQRRKRSYMRKDEVVHMREVDSV